MFNNHTYVQVDGVSMGSPLGPTMADFYMSNLENVLLNVVMGRSIGIGLYRLKFWVSVSVFFNRYLLSV